MRRKMVPEVVLLIYSKPMVRRTSGVTAIELVITILIIGILFSAFSALFRVYNVNLIGGLNRARATTGHQQITARIEPDIYAANYVQIASATFVQFIVDANRWPNYNPQGDFDGDGIINEQDPDVDNDANVTKPVGQEWKAGFNLKDDDDDNDGNVDVRIRYYLQGRTLFRQTSYDGAPMSAENSGWSSPPQKIADDVLSLKFTYFGNKASTLGAALDKGNDGVAGTADAGENDGIITATEIDMCQPPGNRNGILDTLQEKSCIMSIRIQIQMDTNNDGKSDYTVETTIAPPLLAVKPLQL